MEWLDLYVDIAESAGLKRPLMEACQAIGILHNTLVCSLSTMCVCACMTSSCNHPASPLSLKGNFDRACVYFKKCYTLCCEVGSPEDLHSAAVQYGIASAHTAMEGFADRLTITDSSSVEVCMYIYHPTTQHCTMPCTGHRCCSLPLCVPANDHWSPDSLAIGCLLGRSSRPDY